MLILMFKVYFSALIIANGPFNCLQVGQTLSVMIHSVDEMRSNLVLSERKAWVRFKVVFFCIEILYQARRFDLNVDSNFFV